MGFALALPTLGVRIIGNGDPVSIAFIFDDRPPVYIDRSWKPSLDKDHADADR